MKRYTQAEFDAFERDEKGIKYCPTGDYSQIENFGRLCNFGKCCRFGKYCCFGECCSFGDRCIFGECCSFGKQCSFGDRCIFGERCNFEGIGRAKPGYPFAAIGSGSRKGSKTYFFNLEQGIYVRCGGFLGTLPEFREKVRETHGPSRLTDEYLAIANLVERKSLFSGIVPQVALRIFETIDKSESK